MSNAPDESIAHKFDTFAPPRVWQARPRARRRGGLPGCRSDDAQVSSVPTPSSRWSSGAPAPPQPYRAQPRWCGRRRDAAPSVAKAARQGREYQRTLTVCPRLPHPFDGDIAIAGSCSSPAYAPSCQTMRH